MQAIDVVKIICYDRNIYVPQSLHIRVLYWYHLYINHPGGSILAKTILELCYWKGLVTQAELFAKTCNICQQFKNRNTLYVHLPPNNIVELKPWYTVHVDLIVPYINSIRQQQLGRTVILNNSSLTYMMMIDPATGWFVIAKIPTFDLERVALGNDEYIYK